ncbi:hypothetical protein N7454_000160 [Penicillium verhagenii]|nr:hypothetical protein N7454_000160 [Penicillium verhagenii]
MPDENSSNSLPRKAPCISYWQRTTRAFPHLFENQHTRVPARAKYVIVGSGLSGALTAFELLEAGIQGEDVVILEAREAASGATSRNAGHVRPDAFRGFNAYAKVHGPEQALKIIENERLVLDKVAEFVNKHDVQCDFNLTSTFDVCMTSEFAKYESESLGAYERAGGETSHIKYYEGEEARAKTRVHAAVAAYEWPAGSCHPAKLVHFLLRSVIGRGAKLFTFCPAKAIQQHESELRLWDVHTARGTITTEKIIHCTNAHAALLLPQLEAYVTPNRAQAHSLIANSAFGGEKILDKTFSLRYSLYHFYSLIQRKGGCRLSTDDSHFSQEIVEDALNSFGRMFPDYTSLQDAAHGEGLDHAWTGIIAMTPDSVPFVGAIGSLPGQYICAGFNGHGMARIFTSAPGVAKIALGDEWSATGLPECFQFSKERLSRLADGGLPSIW